MTPAASPSPRVLKEIGTQVQVAARYLGHKFPHLREDILQEAWQVALVNAHRYDPDNPGAHIFFTRIATLWCAENINRWIATTSVSRDAARAGVGAKQIAFPVEKVLAGCSTTIEADIEAADDRREELFRLAHLRIRWRREADRVMSRLPEEDARVGALLFGLDGPAQSPAWVARHLRVCREDVEAAGRRCRRVMKKWLAYREQIEQLEGAIG